MKKYQSNLGLKWLAAILLAGFTAAAALLGFWGWMQLSVYYSGDGTWQSCRQFHDMLSERANEAYAMYQDQLWLEQETDIDYVTQKEVQNYIQEKKTAFHPQKTWFRFQIKSGDGQTVQYSNLEAGEELSELVEQVYYMTFRKEENRTGDAENFILEYGVPTQVGDGSRQDEFSRLALQSAHIQDHRGMMLTALLSVIGLLFLCVLYLLWGAGHQSKTGELVPMRQDHIFLEPYLLVVSTGFTLLLSLVSELMGQGEWIVQRWLYYRQDSQELIGLLLAGIALSAIAAMFCVMLVLRTIAVRMKTNTLGQTCLVGWVWRVGRRAGSFGWQILQTGMRSLPMLWKGILFFVLYVGLSLCFLFEAVQSRDLFLLLWILLQGATLALLCWWILGMQRLRQGGRALADGNMSYQVNTIHMPQDLRRHGEDLNHIAMGMRLAVEEQMKSERFKAELITNVSHDLKTPLTSIINYLDLLKSTEQKDPSALEYLEVLDRKSIHLKKLTEDLVEASKASTGVLKVQREKISLTRLVDQALGEWQEKLEARGLTVVTTLPEEEIWVNADGRHLWRVLDNLLSNCWKYALEHTRVYLELRLEEEMVFLSLKNISREALNIPPQELMERFVRGEASRTTEGSGLGLSIAQSLTELQGGSFQLWVDGDLFKAVLKLPVCV